MKNGTTSAALVGLIGGVALGVWVGAEMTSGRSVAEVPRAVEQTVAAPALEPVKDTPRRVRVVRAVPAKVAPTKVVPANARAVAPKLVMTIPVSAPELHDRLKPVLARGTKIPLAVEGFKDAELFATIAHAARNTQVPFILLKHRVLAEGQSLEAAILASKPDLDAAGAVARARREARSDIAALTSNTATDE